MGVIDDAPPSYAMAVDAPPVGAPVCEAQVVSVVGVGDVIVRAEVSLDERVYRMQMALDVSAEVVKDMLSVVGCSVVVVADDSGSMGNLVSGTKSRWDELQETLRQLATLLLVVEHRDGFALQFLNDPFCSRVEGREIGRRVIIERLYAGRGRRARQSGGFVPRSTRNWHTVHTVADVDEIFRGRGPRGLTPLRARLEPILSGNWHPRGPGAEAEVLLLLLTDGEPSDCSFEELRATVKAKIKTVYLTVVMCTEEDLIVDKYNRFMDKLPGVDITDDYASEKKEVERRRKKLTHNAWLAKAVLGGKITKYDQLDDPAKCCTVL
ncbi:hypothetical protein M885DRAFT_219509 [Pelagophyceae sp. CCMP2097]|nr:hypothetical protein M885DRAFT_219509 [Pelagophyceae sp. CCMP2097]